MDRLRGKTGQKIRLFQRVGSAGTITVYKKNGTIKVGPVVTTQFLASQLYYYDFTPGTANLFIISWDAAPANRQWQIIDIDTADIDDVQITVDEINAETPHAEVG